MSRLDKTINEISSIIEKYTTDSGLRSVESLLQKYLKKNSNGNWVAGSFQSYSYIEMVADYLEKELGLEKINKPGQPLTLRNRDISLRVQNFTPGGWGIQID